ncbi:hypothetical protein KP509_37G057500 [Ceratopteris richardii]|uniref:RSE1/DDB1/CPSF1 second beta-propeller domain-containing protein n=1 Tax=Ceratopteris richardii TaxID=49495 RepID=A0A8T2Q8F2_CERRI|nr:hypothetical protein KP509_37G057500 [Ceratopteris richardii]
MELHYEQMKAGSLITAACVGYITSAKSSQLVLCKQLTVEVWDLKDNNLRQAATIELSLPVIDCVVLQCPQVFTELLPGSNQKEHPSHNGFGHLDSLLVVNNHGTIMILRWDATAGKLTKCPPSEISEDSWINLSMMITETNISKPFFMPSNVSIKRSYAQDMLGVSIVAVCSFENIIQLVCVSWEMRHQIDDSCTCSSSASKIKELSRITHNLKIHFLKVPNEIALISDVTPSQRTLSILGLCFMGDNTSDCRSLNASALDFKGRPLLVILSASKGLCQNILSLDCFAADLNDKQLGYGPWKMRNLHPTTNLLIPWKYYDTPEGEIIEDRRGANVPLKIGVLLVSSVAITLIKADGKRCSSMVSLKGIPACCDVCNNFRMVIADTCSTMYILDGGDWSNIKMQIILFDYPLSVPQVVHCFNYGGISGSETVSIFVCGEGGDIHIFGLLGKTIAKAGQSSCTIESENFVTAETLWSSMVYDTFGGNNVGKKEKLQDHDFQLSGATPVHDSLLLCDDDCSSNCQLLLACGNSPNGTLCRVTLAFQSVVDEVYDVQIHSLPKILTFTLNMNHPNKVHIVLSYEVQDASELLEWTETGLASCFMEGFDADHQTLAIEMIHSKLIVQVTSKSVRLFEGEGLFISEWLPSTVFQGSTDKRLSDKPSRISAAAMNSKGIALAAMRNLYTLDVDVNGCFRVLGSRFHQYEVSTIGVCLLQESIPRNDETCHFGGLDLVIVGEWVSNMACLLTWPDMKGIVRVDCGSLGSMRSIAIADVGGLQYLFLGSTAGDLYFLNLIVQYVRNEEIGKGNADYFTSEEDEGLEILAAAKTERDYFMIVDNMQRNLKVTVMGRSSFKVGSSEVFVRTGRFFGSKSPQVRTVSSSPSAFIYAYTSENSAVAFRENKTLGAYTVHGTGYSAISTTSFHSERFPYSLISVCRNGNLIISHLDTSPKLCWDTVHLDGKPSLLAYHKGNDSAIVSCQGHNSAWLSFFQVRNLKHVLTVPLGEDCRNTLLGVMEFSYSPSVGRVPECCLIIGSNNYNNPVGSLSFIGYQSFNPDFHYNIQRWIQHLFLQWVDLGKLFFTVLVSNKNRLIHVIEKCIQGKS